ncbi:MAG TPA: branched-chain amino acid aminotransferase [Syntrophobacteraceae bacterium]|nr:branched-chain amino acid aminotransferase [Syntrophobacteraceae bacterium]
MEITIRLIDPARRHSKPEDETKLVFGRTFSDHMFMLDWRTGKGWQDARIVPYQDLQLNPAAMVLHYGQGIFEGLKAYRWHDGTVHLFRPEKNWERFNRSARRMCMPEIDIALQFKFVEGLLRIDQDWVPHSVGSSLYVRPTMIATEGHLGVRPASEYLYYIITGPVAAYYAEGFNPVKIYVSDEFVRTVRGGVGEAKTMANYASSLLAAELAKKKGFTQVLWLDAIEKRFVEEVGTMNIFFRIHDDLITPALSGSILSGVTRDSVIQLARHWGISVQERQIDIHEVIDAVKSGAMKEIFGTGTAAVVSPVGAISFKEQSFSVQDGGVGEWSHRFYDEIVGIQYGERPDKFGWVYNVKS